jgi:hypothetical protein
MLFFEVKIAVNDCLYKYINVINMVICSKKFAERLAILPTIFG